MKRREQALLLLRKAGQDEALLDEILASQSVDDEVIGFHCQQAAEKILKALLSDLGVRFRKTHDIGWLIELMADSGCPLPVEFTGLEEFTPFAVAYRYEDYEADSSLDRDQARLKLRTLRSWVEAKLQGNVVRGNRFFRRVKVSWASFRKGPYPLSYGHLANRLVLQVLADRCSFVGDIANRQLYPEPMVENIDPDNRIPVIRLQRHPCTFP